MTLIESVMMSRRRALQFTGAAAVTAAVSSVAKPDGPKDLLGDDKSPKAPAKPKQVQAEIDKIKSKKNTGDGSGIKKTMIPSESATLGEWTVDVIPQGGSDKVKIFVYALNDNGEIKKGEKGLLGYQGEVDVTKLTAELKNVEVDLKLLGYVEKNASPILWIEGTRGPKQESGRSLFKISEGSTWGENTPGDLQNAVLKLLTTEEGSLDNVKLKSLFGIKRLSGSSGGEKKVDDKPAGTSSRALLLDTLYAAEVMPVDLLA